jgi:hypothetical protein
VYHNEVNEAFEILLEEIEVTIGALNEDVAEALRQRNYEEALQIVERTRRITGFRDRILALQKEWQEFFPSRPREGIEEIIEQTCGGHLPRNLRTPEGAFRKPILEALVELGGSAPANRVLELVEKKMEGILNEYDYRPLRSGETRWRNTAQWCRYVMVQEGLLRSDSPRGIWEISEQGRAELEKM